jgi:hypothetical protein
MQSDPPDDTISLTGSGEVHKLLGSQELPRRQECLPEFRGPALGNWGVEIDSSRIGYKYGQGNPAEKFTEPE